MATQYGLTAQGFVPKQQADIVSELQAAFKQAFGGNVNLGPESVFSQLIGIFSEREALLWQLGEAIYQSQYPAGAEGTSVDNILALNNLKRLGATATVTNPEPLVRADRTTLYGLLLFGTPGTVIPAGSLISNGASPPLTFATDADATIAAAQNARQRLVFSNSPNTGTYRLTFTPPSGYPVTTASLAFNTQATQTNLGWGLTPSTGAYRLALTTGESCAVTAPVSAGSDATTLQAAVQALTGYSGVTVSGSEASGFAFNFPSGNPIPILDVAATSISFAPTPPGGSYGLTLDGVPTALLAYNATASAVQAAIRAVSGYETACVTGTVTDGFFVVWGTLTAPTVAIASNSTGVTITAATTYTLDQAATVVNALQAQINVLPDLGLANLPFTDVAVASVASGFTFSFGGLTPLSGQPSSGSTPQPIITVAQNSLQSGTSVTNIALSNVNVGAWAQAVASATCTQTGANFIAAGALSTIVTPVGGWASVTNQLDCITGSNLESDTDAILRRSTLLAAQANGPLQAIEEKLLQVSGVTTAIGFQNLGNAALQRIAFDPAPPSGSFKLALNGQITAAIPYTATASDVQAEINALDDFANVLVTGTLTASPGLEIDFNGSQGGQAQPLILVTNNTTGSSITPTFGRPPHSYEIVVQGGQALDIAKTILGAAPAGITSYGAPAYTTTGSVSYGSQTMTVADDGGGLIEIGQAVKGYGLPPGTIILARPSSLTYTLSQPSQLSGSGNTYVFDYTTQVTDRFGNPVLVSFSRPKQVLIYITVQLVTDLYNTPGVSASGNNPNAAFNPQSVIDIQQNLVEICNAVPIGGLIVGMGSGGLIGAFNSVPGIVSYNLYFDRAPLPSTSTNVQLFAEELAVAETFNTAVSYV